MRTRAVADRRSADRRSPDPRRFESLLGAFIEDLRVKRYAPSSEKRAINALPRFFIHLRDEGVRDLRAVGEAHLASYARKLRAAIARYSGAPLRPMTRRGYLHVVRRFFAFLTRTGVLLRNPAADLVLQKPDHLPRTVLTPRQAERLIHSPSRWSWLGQREWAILELLYGTGIRRGECVRLDVSDVDLQQGTVLVRDAKGKRDRLIPIPARAAIALDVYLRESRPEIVKDPRERALFLSYTTGSRGRRLAAGSINVIVTKHTRAAKIPHHVHPHALRHSCATHLLQGGADLKHAQELLGHRRITSTATYTRVSVKDLLKVFERSHPRERRPRRRARAR